jgi:hypothetical protein
MAEEQQGQESVFNSRADSAAMALKGQLSQSLGIDLPSRQVPVGEDGQPVGQPPPEGSYARQIAQQHAHMQAQARQQVQGDQAQEAVQHAPPQQQTPDTTPRTQERIETLISKLNDKDRELGELRQQQATHATTHQQLQAQLQERDAQMQNMLKEHMENLDPETRAQIMTDARIKQAMDVSEQRILSILGPQLRTLQGNAAQAEKAKLSDMFPGVYNPQRHDELIDAFRRENPKSVCGDPPGWCYRRPALGFESPLPSSIEQVGDRPRRREEVDQMLSQLPKRSIILVRRPHRQRMGFEVRLCVID